MYSQCAGSKARLQTYTSISGSARRISQCSRGRVIFSRMLARDIREVDLQNAWCDAPNV